MIVTVVVMPRGSEITVRRKEVTAEDQGKGDLSPSRAEDSRSLADLADFLLDFVLALFSDEIAFVQQNNVTVTQLIGCRSAFEVVEAEIFGVRHGDDRINANQIAKLRAQQYKHDQQRVRDTCRFEDHVIHLRFAAQQSVEGLDKVGVDRASDASVAQFHHLAGGDDELVIDRDVADFVDHNGDLEPMLICQDMVQQRRLPTAEKAGYDRDWQARFAVHRAS
jgi:hypothetical protein